MTLVSEDALSFVIPSSFRRNVTARTLIKRRSSLIFSALLLMFSLSVSGTLAQSGETAESDDADATGPPSLESVRRDLERLNEVIEDSQASPGGEEIERPISRLLEQAEQADDRAAAARARAREALERATQHYLTALEKAGDAAGQTAASNQAEVVDEKVTAAGASTDEDEAETEAASTLAAVGLSWSQLLLYAAVAIAGLVLFQALVATGGVLRHYAHRGRQRQREDQLFRDRLAAVQRERQEAEARTLHWSGLRRFEVRAKRPEDEDGKLCSFELVPHDGKPIPSYYPGQYLTFQFKIPGQSKQVVRCYSLSDAPQEDHYRITVKRLDPPPDKPDAPSGLVSTFLHEQVEEGETVEARAPAGSFYLDPRREDEPVVLIGCGVGITPLLSMLNAVAEAGGRREVWLFYGVRHGGEHIMKSHFAALGRDFPSLRIHVCYSQPREQDRAGQDYDHEGHVSVDLLKQMLPSNNYAFCVCGPPVMMEKVVEGLKEWGVPDRDIHTEQFGPASHKKKPKAVSANASGPTVTFRRSGVTANWDAEAEDLWSFAQANEVKIDSGCLEGRCGTCETAVLSGNVKYQTDPAYPFEEGSCLPCCAVPDGPVELDA